MKRRNDTIEYGIIGLGRFGTALATALSEAGKEVMVVDNTESKVKQIRDLVSEAFVVEGIDRDSFESAGIQNCETVIVCIGEKIDTSILATLTVISMGVPRVISKATSAEHGCVLEKIGAEVVYPEKQMAFWTAIRYSSDHIFDYISLGDDYAIFEVEVPDSWVGKTIRQLDVRKRFHVNIMAIKQDGKFSMTVIAPDTCLPAHSTVLVMGTQRDLQKCFRI